MAVDYNWLFSYYNPCTAGNSFCTGRVYVEVFNRDNEAVDFAAAPKVFDTYVNTQDRFRKFLATHAQRTRYHYGLVNCSELDIPDNPFGEDYIVEYWCEAVSGTPNRLTDNLVKVDRVIFAADRVHESRLDISREQNIAALAGLAVFTQIKSFSDAVPNSWGQYLSNPDNFSSDTSSAIFSGFSGANVGECLQGICNRMSAWPDVVAGVQWVCHAGFSFDTVLQVMNLACWLEKDGQVQTDPLTYQIAMIDSSGNVIFNVTGDASDLEADYGVFFKMVSNVTLTPDETYYALITINDVDDEPHQSAAAPVAWD